MTNPIGAGAAVRPLGRHLTTLLVRQVVTFLVAAVLVTAGIFWLTDRAAQERWRQCEPGRNAGGSYVDC